MSVELFFAFEFFNFFFFPPFFNPEIRMNLSQEKRVFLVTGVTEAKFLKINSVK